jgi:hypothetical protein
VLERRAPDLYLGDGFAGYVFWAQKRP